jgi:hypothetical protein
MWHIPLSLLTYLHWIPPLLLPLARAIDPYSRMRMQSVLCGSKTVVLCVCFFRQCMACQHAGEVHLQEF